jgi:hypothetical protein
VIPRVNSGLSAEVPPEATFWTPHHSEIDDEGFSYFHNSWYLGRVPVGDARAVIEMEAAMLKLVDHLANDEADFDALATLLETGELSSLPARLNTDELREMLDPLLSADDDVPLLQCLDFGVAGLSYALASIPGFFPAASCRGNHGPTTWSRYPVVVFAADEFRVRVLVRLVLDAGCGFAVDSARPDLLAVGADSIRDTISLAHSVVASRSAFRRPRSEIRKHRKGVDSSQGVLDL